MFKTEQEMVIALISILKNKSLSINQARDFLIKHKNISEFIEPEDYVISTRNRKTNTIKNISNREFPVFTALRSLITDINFINIGTLKKVHDENYVDVVLYYKTELGEETVIPAVRLLHIGTTKCKLKIVPAVGDNVLLLCPKDFRETIE